MFKNEKIILTLACFFFVANLFAQEPAPIIEEIMEEPPAMEIDFSVDDSKKFTPPTVIPKKVRRKKLRGRFGFYGGSVVVIPFIYDKLPKQFSDFMIAKKAKKFGVINKKNEVVVPFIYDNLYVIYDDYKTKKESGFIKAKSGELFGVLDKKGTIVIPIKYKTFERWGNENYLVGPVDGKYGVLSKEGKIIHPFTFEKKPWRAYDYHYVIQINGKQGVCDVYGKKVIPLKYDRISSTSYNTHLNTMLNGKYGLLDKTGKQVLPFEYSQINEKKDGTFIVTQNDMRGVLDSNFNLIVPIAYSDIKKRNDNYFLVRKKDGYGIVNLKGKEILPCEYQRLLLTQGKIFIGRKNGVREYSVIDENAEPVISQKIWRVTRLEGTDFFQFQKEEEGKYALFNSISQKIVTEFEYDGFFTKRKKGGKRRDREVHFKKDGITGVMSATGEKSNVGSVKNTTSYKKNDQINQTKATIKKNIVGTWEGEISVGGKLYWRELVFENGEKGERRIYHEKDGKLCVLTQQFKTVLIGEGSSRPFQMLVKIATHPISNCGIVPEFFASSTNQFQQEWLNFGRLSYDPLQIKEVSQKTETGEIDLSKIKRKILLQKVAGDLKSKLIIKPGGGKDVRFIIDPNTLELFIENFGNKNPFGKIQLEGNEYILSTSQWETTGHYSLSGTLKKVKYIGPDGKVKTGDLDLCIKASTKKHYWLKEFKQD